MRFIMKTEIFLRSLMDILNLESDKEKLLSLDEFNQKSWQVDLEEEIDERKKEKIIKTLWNFLNPNI